jgi:hypothetical protein
MVAVNPRPSIPASGGDSRVQEDEAIVKEEEKQRQRARADRLVVAAEQYPRMALPITRALRPILQAKSDLGLLASVERIDELTLSITTKIYRAVAGSAQADYDPSEQQSDVNGSAKIARLMIADSRRAWEKVIRIGQASADGMPARIVARLDDLDPELARRFPQAMSFIRPGFDDTESADSTAGRSNGQE